MKGGQFFLKFLSHFFLVLTKLKLRKNNFLARVSFFEGGQFFLKLLNQFFSCFDEIEIEKNNIVGRGIFLGGWVNNFVKRKLNLRKNNFFEIIFLGGVPYHIFLLRESSS